MKKIIVFDTNPDFIEGVKQFMDVEELTEPEFLAVTKSFPDYTTALNKFGEKADAVLFNTDTITYTNSEGDIGIDAFFYSTSGDTEDIPDYGEYIGLFKYGDEEEFVETLINKKTTKNNFKKKEEAKEEVPEKEKIFDDDDDDEDTFVKTKKQKIKEPEEEIEEKQDDKPEEKPVKKKKTDKPSDISDEDWAEFMAFKKSKESNAAKDLKESNEEKLEKEAEDDFKKSVSAKEKHTEVVSIFSAKGGTGKTTIAVQIASRLSRIPRGRGFISVCLIDFDYEFGDVAAVLALPDYEGEPLTALINKVNKGKPITKEEIKDYCLQPEGIPTDTLYVIPAPATHIASLRLKIGTEAVTKLIEAIKATKEFDYIICDTGNNLNPTTLGILGVSDTVYAIYTPDYTTIKCNDSALNSLVALDSENDNKSFYQGKFKAILNRESNLSGLEGADIEKALNVPVSACVKVDDRVVYFNNDNYPIVFDEDCGFNAEIAPVIKEISGEDFELPETEPKKKKKGLFSFFKKKKR